MNLRVIIYLLLSLASFKAYSQTDTAEINSEYLSINDRDKISLGIITGWHQWKYGFGEIGVGFAKSDWGHHGNMFHAASLSLELNPWKNIYGYKISVWKSIPLIPLSLGINGVHYRSMGPSDWTIRPMLGLGYENIHLTYSYDIRLGSRDITERNSHMLSLRYFIPIIRVKTHNKT